MSHASRWPILVVQALGLEQAPAPPRGSLGWSTEPLLANKKT